MKISEMNKQELLDYMRASREIHRYDADSATWKRAFQLIRLAGYENLEHGCGKCVKTVTEWLQR